MLGLCFELLLIICLVTRVVVLLYSCIKDIYQTEDRRRKGYQNNNIVLDLIYFEQELADPRLFLFDSVFLIFGNFQCNGFFVPIIMIAAHNNYPKILIEFTVKVKKYDQHIPNDENVVENR